MSFTPEQVAMLNAPLDRAHVKEREQSGRKLSYVEGWHAIAEANRIFGFDAWTRETLEIRLVSERERKIGRPPNQKDGWGVSYVARCRVDVGGVTREGVGAGHGIDADLGLAHESAIKEAETDAMKRALMTFGNPFGLALYDKTQANVGYGDRDAGKVQNPDTGRMVNPGSANQLRKSGVWQEMEAEVRTARTIPALQEIEDRWIARARAENWTKAWVSDFNALFGDTYAEIEEAAAREGVGTFPGDTPSANGRAAYEQATGGR